ncbi:U2 small nuclear ribonucleoprotein auxiliary factor 35 kDa subunit-related protein 1-like [Periophthalmus magnuspinnatus]|uniref:U2 small nuclear ribonucleoprotein auxiliary factor 35 kDa subunit-related protein 1-like n=1 Tax=Periophthalmus magnuspinnatus TaxID=409849 RepID=UPI002436B15B|nr:U2 small nuclear ribonucleoprotein auxiliary factor 35 kDa subunit-related protein 1-like [Periophthalmus magnuspinnatus]
MAHVYRFYEIPMSKSMRGLCKEEDYTFLGNSGNICKVQTSESEEEEIACREERVRRQMEREKKERERLRQLEESKKEKEERWRSHVAQLTSSQEKILQQRLDRIRKFREFQRQVLLDEAEAEGEAGQDRVDHAMARI